MTSSRLWTVVPILLLVLYAAASLATLTTFPLVWLDEGWYVSSAGNFVLEGTFGMPMFDDLAGLDRDNVAFGRVYLAALAAAFAALDISPESARLVSFASGIVAVVSMFALGRELWGSRTAVIAAVLLALSPVFIDQSHDARPEIMTIAFTLAAFALLLAGERRSNPALLVLAGIVAVLAADVHLNGAMVPIALGAVLLVRRATRRTMVLFLAGAVLGSLWWLWVHVLGDPALFVEQIRTLNTGQLPVSVLLDQPVLTIGYGFARFIRVDAGSSALLVVGLAATYELLRRHRDLALMSVLTFAGVQFVFMFLFVNNQQPVYAVLLWPTLALLVARLLSVIDLRLAALIGTGLVVISLIFVGQMVLRDRGADFGAYLERLDAAIPDDAVVMGQPSVWFGFTDQPFVASQYFVWRPPFVDGLREQGVEYVIADEYLLVLQLVDLEEFPADEVERFLAEHGEVVAEFEDSHYGRYQTAGDRPYVTKVYRILE